MLRTFLRDHSREQTASGKRCAQNGFSSTNQVSSSTIRGAANDPSRKGPYKKEKVMMKFVIILVVVTVKFPDLLTTDQRGKSSLTLVPFTLGWKNNSVNKTCLLKRIWRTAFRLAFFILLDLLDDVSGRATVFEVEHQHFAAVI